MINMLNWYDVRKWPTWWHMLAPEIDPDAQQSTRSLPEQPLRPAAQAPAPTQAQTREAELQALVEDFHL